MYYPQEDIVRHVSELSRHLNNPRHIIQLLLMELGIPPRRDGFVYLQHAIWLYRQDATQMMSKSLYPEVARLCGRPTGGKQVERAIRAAVQGAWETREEAVWRRYFPAGHGGTVRRPTNAEFIANVALVLDLWQGCTARNSQQCAR